MTKSILNIENLSISFKTNNSDIEAINNVSFSINEGEVLALVGESGSGKTVTALSILQLLPKNAFYKNGKINSEGRNLLDNKKNYIKQVRGKEISMIFQEPMTSLNPLHTVEKQIKESIKLYNDFRSEELNEYMLYLIETVGLINLKNRLNAYPHELSGGQKQRVMIAMAIANKPKILIADEPTTALDVTIQSQILKLLKELQRKLGMSILLITHDLNIVKELAQKICIMKNGIIVEKGDVNKIFVYPKNEYTKKLINTEPIIKILSVNQNKDILQVKNLSVNFPIKKGLFRKTVKYLKALDNISFSLKKGETLGVVGESGCGKTTLGLSLLRLIKSEGKILFNNNNINILNNYNLRPTRKEIQIVFQDPYGSLSPRLSVKQIIEEGLLVHEKNLTKLNIEEKVDNALQDVGLDTQTKNRYPHEFSGGQRQRIAIARAIILKPKLLILDEPTSALDKTVQNQILNLLNNLQNKLNLSYIFISHDIRVIKSLSDKIAVIHKGKIIEYGKTKKVFFSPQMDYTKLLIKSSNI